MFNDMKKVMPKSEYKKLSFTEKFISNFVVKRCGGWELFKDRSDYLDKQKEDMTTIHHNERMGEYKKIRETLARIDSEMLDMNKVYLEKGKVHFLFDDIQKIVKYLTNEKHLTDDQLYDVLKKKNITLAPIEEHPQFPEFTTNKLTNQEFKILVNELYELRETENKT